VFKRLFGLERNLPVLKHVLNAVLEGWHPVPVTHLDLLNPFNEKETTDDKLSIVDLKARDQEGRHFNVEMQMLSNWVFFESRPVLLESIARPATA
jgi:predicted transposase/invertase (TIGR01784 family)